MVRVRWRGAVATRLSALVSRFLLETRLSDAIRRPLGWLRRAVGEGQP